MEMTGSQRIEASRERVWQGLNDPEILRASIPGCERVEKLSDTAMTAVVTLRVGPVKASFQGDVTFVDLDPPNGYTIKGEGRGGAAGYAKGSARVSLLPEGSGTALNYAVKADVGGKLAQLGGRLIDSTANRLAAEFFVRFAKEIGGPAEATPSQQGAAVATPPSATTAISPIQWFTGIAVAALAVGLALWFAR